MFASMISPILYVSFRDSEQALSHQKLVLEIQMSPFGYTLSGYIACEVGVSVYMRFLHPV
jgi:hypothetical protein